MRTALVRSLVIISLLAATCFVGLSASAPAADAKPICTNQLYQGLFCAEQSQHTACAQPYVLVERHCVASNPHRYPHAKYFAWDCPDVPAGAPLWPAATIVEGAVVIDQCLYLPAVADSLVPTHRLNFWS